MHEMSMASLKRLGRVLQTTISSGSNISDVVDIRTVDVFGFIFPQMTSTGVTFQIATSSDGTFHALFLGSSALSLDVSTSTSRATVLDVDRQPLTPWQWFRIVSSATEAEARSISICAK